MSVPSKQAYDDLNVVVIVIIIIIITATTTIIYHYRYRHIIIISISELNIETMYQHTDLFICLKAFVLINNFSTCTFAQAVLFTVNVCLAAETLDRQ